MGNEGSKRKRSAKDEPESKMRVFASGASSSAEGEKKGSMKVKGFSLIKKASYDVKTGKIVGWDDLFQALETYYMMPNSQPKADNNIFTIVRTMIKDSEEEINT
jgi:hypothetical protein